MAISNRQFPSVTMVDTSEGLDARIETSNGYGFLRVTQDASGATIILGKDGNRYVQKTKLVPEELTISGNTISFNLCWPEGSDEPITTYYLYANGRQVAEIEIFPDAETGNYIDPYVNQITNLYNFQNGVYEINVTACQEGKRQSSFSNTAMYARVPAPTIYITNNVLTWNEIVSAEKYNIKYDYNTIAEVLASETRSFDLYASVAIPFTQDGTPKSVNVEAVNITCNNSAQSSGLSYLKMVAPVIALNGSKVTWDDVTGATSYGVIVDGEIVPGVSATSSFNLSSLSLQPGTYGIQIEATCSVNGVSISNTVVYEKEAVPSFENATWSEIKAHSDDASSYWNVGDTKSITINGTIVGTSYSNLSTKVMILDFDHDANNPKYEDGGLGITLICFRDYSGFDGNIFVSLIDSNYNTSVYDPDAPVSDWTPAFIYGIEGEVDADIGAWKGSYMRNTVLGSTNVPSGSADDTEITNPKANSFMAALPSDLRTVLSPMWTDEVVYYYDPETEESGYRYESYKGYCKLMSEKEISGSESQVYGYYYFNNESQFSWFINNQWNYWAAILNNSDLETMRNATEGGYTTPTYWTRTPYTINYYSSQFMRLSEYDSGGMAARVTSYGISPILRIGPTVNS